MLAGRGRGRRFAPRHAGCDRVTAEARLPRGGTTAADRYATDVTTIDAEARGPEAAKRQADEIIDYADREATARREEAEAVYEHQRARAAAAAADFEQTLAERRNKSAEEFAAQMQNNEQAITMAQERQAAIEAEADRTLAEAKAQAEAQLKAARDEAAHHVDSARLAAEKIRRESERELQAASSRRDAITAQLTNVRQMLATLGGAAIVNPLAEPEEAPAVGEVSSSSAIVVEDNDEAPADDEVSSSSAIALDDNDEAFATVAEPDEAPATPDVEEPKA